jgi:hypothetical protein
VLAVDRQHLVALAGEIDRPNAGVIDRLLRLRGRERAAAWLVFCTGSSATPEVDVSCQAPPPLRDSCHA